MTGTTGLVLETTEETARKIVAGLLDRNINPIGAIGWLGREIAAAITAARDDEAGKIEAWIAANCDADIADYIKAAIRSRSYRRDL